MTKDFQKSIRLISEGRVLAECGPMRLVIGCRVGRVPQPLLGRQAAGEAFGYLERLARLRHLLSRPAPEVPGDLRDPLAVRMLENVRAVGDLDLTPMAAVAGSIADAVADFLFDRGMTKVVVDNGGDVAVRLRPGETASVGLQPQVQHPDLSHVLRLDSRVPAWGIATSGLGGRSLTRGIASAATVIAESACRADAAATALANATFVPDPGIVQRPAEELDPESDIAGLPVTVRVETLSAQTIERAFSQAMEKAETLVARGVIRGAFLQVQGRTDMTRFFRALLGESWEAGKV